MTLRSFSLVAVALLCVSTIPKAFGGGWPFHHKEVAPGSSTLEQIARSIDRVEERILDDGTVVTKQPDVYGQSRMTLYRKNFEQQLFGAIDNFNFVLSARVTRSDQAAFLSQSNLQATLATAPSGGGRRGVGRGAGGRAAGAAASSTTAVVTPAPSGGGAGPGEAPGAVVPDALALGSINRSAPFAPFGGQPFATIGQPNGLGLEPTVYLNQLANFQNHLNEIRRINMGDDIADSPGYGLYLIRMPVSIQPGECTNRGYGAVLTATVRHDFGPEFLPQTYRNLVINDLVDQLGPITYELIRSGKLDGLGESGERSAFVQKYTLIKNFIFPTDVLMFLLAKDRVLDRMIEQRDTGALEKFFRDTYASFDFQRTRPLYDQALLRPRSAMAIENARRSAQDSPVFRNLAESRAYLNGLFEQTIRSSITRVNERSYPVSPVDYDDVFIDQNLFALAISVRGALRTATPRATEIRAYLRRSLEAAYDLAPHYEAIVPQISEHLESRNFEALKSDYLALASQLPGDLSYLESGTDADGAPEARDVQNSLISVPTILCFAIAVEDALLNKQLRTDIRRVLPQQGMLCEGLEVMQFHVAQPDPETVRTFEAYIKARWPLITFALDPFVDQQNIADATSVRRDLQLALSFAFSSGQINFRQLLQFQRRLEFDAETIALNRTVTSFSHGDDTFGFRFTPRYQNPPPEKSNFHVLYNQVVRGGPGRNYQLQNSKLEPGQRELTAVVIMPSFLRGIQMDVTGNWFPLHDPDQMKVPTPRMIEQEREVVELGESLASIHDHNSYRPGVVQRLESRVHQIGAMLPMQTRTIRIPYENTLGGFALFQEGTSSLVPQIDGFEGADAIEEGAEADLLLFGKHFSVQESHVVVGGKYLSGADPDVVKSIDAAKASVDAAQTSPETPGDGSNGNEPNGSRANAELNSAAHGHLDAARKSLAVAQTMGVAGRGGALLSSSAAATGNTNVDIVTREVIRLKIPSGVLTTEMLDADGLKKKTYVEVYVSTANGISNRLLIPFKKRAKAAPASAPGYSLKATTAKISYVVKFADGKPVLTFDESRSASHIQFQLATTSGVVPTAIDANFMFTLKDTVSVSVPVHGVPVDSADTPVYSIRGHDLKTFAEDLSARLTPYGFFPMDMASGAPLTNLTTKTLKLTPQVAATGLSGKPEPSQNMLTVEFSWTLDHPAPAEPAPQALPEALPDLPIPGGAANGGPAVEGAVAESSTAVAPAFTVENAGRPFLVKYTLERNPARGFRIKSGRPFDDQPISIRWTRPNRPAPAMVRASLRLRNKDAEAMAPPASAPPGDAILLAVSNGLYRIEGLALERLAAALVGALNRTDATFSPSNLIPELTADLIVHPVMTDTEKKDHEEAAANPLKVVWVFVNDRATASPTARSTAPPPVSARNPTLTAAFDLPPLPDAPTVAVHRCRAPVAEPVE